MAIEKQEITHDDSQMRLTKRRLSQTKEEITLEPKKKRQRQGDNTLKAPKPNQEIYCPSELVTDIMSRVPGKSLARFRLVSKQFRSLFSDPCFTRLHHNRSRDSLFTITAREQEYKPESDFSVDSPDPGGDKKIRFNFFMTNRTNDLPNGRTLDFNGRRIRMLSSHHQLLCFATDTGIYLCDPVNKELKRLACLPCFNKSERRECLVSFGFVDATNQYKVFKWPHDLDENRTRRIPGTGIITTWKKVDLKFEVLTMDIVEDGRLKVSPWRRVHKPCPYLLQLSSPVHVNGFIYWTTSDFQIVSFSLQDEIFSTLNLKPPCFRLDTQGSEKSRFFTLSGSRGNLWMIDYDVSSQIIEIWKMEESAWAKIHKIDVGAHSFVSFGEVEMIDIQLDQVLFKLSVQLFYYDAKTNTLKNYERFCNDYQLCHSTDGLLSIHKL